MEDEDSKDDGNSIDLDQYLSFLALYQEHWEAAEWQHPDRAEPLDDEGDEMEEGPHSSLYVRNLLDSAGLQLLQPGLVASAYDGPDKELGFSSRIIWKWFWCGPMTHCR
jgi:hypothetical protein